MCVSGSVAALKVPEIVAELATFSEVRIVLSSFAASHFLNRSEAYNNNAWDRFVRLGGYNLIVSDADEWNLWNKLGDPVLHIELRRWADAIVVAPASADIIAKISSGISDTLLLSVIRAWDFTKPCFICPAMNTIMWTHPSTSYALSILKSWGWQVLGPVEKLLACNETGNGALVKVASIVTAVEAALSTGGCCSDTNTEDSADNTKDIRETWQHDVLQEGWPTSGRYRVRRSLRILSVAFMNTGRGCAWGNTQASFFTIGAVSVMTAIGTVCALTAFNAARGRLRTV